VITEPFQSYPQIKALAAGYFETLRGAVEEGRPIVSGPATIPYELFRAMDLDYLLGEPYGAICAAGGFAEELLPVTEEYGFTTGFCAYSRNFIGSYLKGRGPLGPFRAPDVMLGVRAGCNDHVAWFETLSKMADRPYFAVDLPQCGEGVSERHIAYVERQLEQLIGFVERATNRQMVEQRLVETVNNAHQLRVLWNQVLACCKNVPAPLNFKSQMSFMTAAVWLKGTKEALDVYAGLLDEIKDRMQRGVASAQEEKARLFWDNVPMWYHPQVFNYLERQGLVPIVSPYIVGWGDNPLTHAQVPQETKDLLAWQAPRNRQEALRETAKEFLRPHAGVSNLESKLTYYEGVARDYQVDGAVFHSNRGCKNLSLNRFEVARHLEEALQIPVFIFESSMADPRGFDEEELRSRLDAFSSTFLQCFVLPGFSPCPHTLYGKSAGPSLTLHFY
jgi:benzoyl-CoA reductase/2-hydroxyglutaryl-CoA dehydratase subunit BcrC/BadD/HgdB